MRLLDRGSNLGHFFSHLLYEHKGWPDYQFGGGISRELLYGIVPEFHHRINYLNPFSSLISTFISS